MEAPPQFETFLSPREAPSCPFPARRPHTCSKAPLSTSTERNEWNLTVRAGARPVRLPSRPQRDVCEINPRHQARTQSVSSRAEPQCPTLGTQRVCPTPVRDRASSSLGCNERRGCERPPHGVGWASSPHFPGEESQRCKGWVAE